MKRKKITLLVWGMAFLGAVAFALSVAMRAREAPGPLLGDIAELHVLLFFVLNLLVELNYVLLPHGRTLSGGFGIILATMLVFNTMVAVLIAVSGTIIVGGVLKRRPKEPVFFRAAQYALVYSLAGMAMAMYGQLVPEIDPGGFSRMLAQGGIVMAVYLILHVPISNLYMGMLDGMDEKSGWVEEELRQQTGSRYEVMGTVLLFPIAVTMAHSYDAVEIPIVPVILAVLCIITVRYISQIQLHKKLWGQANRDELLDVYNRRYMLVQLSEEMEKAQRYRRPLSIILIDLDNFKKINDKHGHLTGDRLLQAVTDAIASSLRSADTLARFGGDELAIIMPETLLEGAVVIASRVREKIATQKLNVGNGRTIATTVSIGVASLAESPENRQNETSSALIDRADKALYKAKEAGRNCVMTDLEDRSDTRNGGRGSE